MKTSILLLFITITIQLNAQESCIVIYNTTTTGNTVKSNTTEAESLNNFYNDLNNALRKNAPLFSYKLSVNNNEAFFKTLPILKNGVNEMELELAEIILDSKTSFYSNAATNTLLIPTEAYGEKFIIKDSITKHQWTITKTNKKIGKYTCFKATTTKVVKNGKGTFKTPIVAWFTPDIPFNFGPKGYGGLPGLILKLTDKNITYTYEQLTLNTNPKIKNKFKGNYVTQNEFLNYGEQYMNIKY